jgi:hypothetical protein
VPSIAMVIAGDAIYNDTHPYLVESDHEGLLAWLVAIDKIEALKPRAVVVGHSPLAPHHIGKTGRYIQDFMRLDAETTTARELYDRMLALHADRINPASLWVSANTPNPHVAEKTARPSAYPANGSCEMARSPAQLFLPACGARLTSMPAGHRRRSDPFRKSTTLCCDRRRSTATEL